MDKNQLTALIGLNVCKYREQAGMMTQAQLAEKIGVGTPYISRIERGEKTMKLYTLYCLAEALDVTCDALLYRESPSTHVNTIAQLLKDRSTSYLAGIEAIIRACGEHFGGE